jgi:hypothetical protein
MACVLQHRTDWIVFTGIFPKDGCSSGPEFFFNSFCRKHVSASFSDCFSHLIPAPLTKPLLFFHPNRKVDQYSTIKDVERNGFCFSDGVGFVHDFL